MVQVWQTSLTEQLRAASMGVFYRWHRNGELRA